MNLHEMKELAAAPQERVNMFVIDKLESIEGKAIDNGLQLDALHARVGKLEHFKAWACGVGAAIAFVAGLVGWEWGRK